MKKSPLFKSRKWRKNEEQVRSNSLYKCDRRRCLILAKKIYVKNVAGEIKEFESVKDCMEQLNIPNSSLYKSVSKSISPYKSKYYIGYSVENINTKEEKFLEKKNSKKVTMTSNEEKCLMLLRDLNITSIEDLEKRLNQNNSSSIVSAVLPEPVKKKEADTTKRVVGFGDNPVTPTKKASFFTQPTGNLPTKKKVQLPNSKVNKNVVKTSKEEASAREKERNEKEAWRKALINGVQRPEVKKTDYTWNNEDFTVWYTNPVDGKKHLTYSPGYDMLKLEHYICEDEPYGYLPDGILLDSINPECRKEVFERVFDPENGYRAWLNEKQHLVDLFCDVVDGKTVIKDGPLEPVIEGDKVYDINDILFGRLQYLKTEFERENTDGKYDFIHNEVLEEFYSKYKVSKSFPIRTESNVLRTWATKENRKYFLLHEVSKIRVNYKNSRCKSRGYEQYSY